MGPHAADGNVANQKARFRRLYCLLFEYSFPRVFYWAASSSGIQSDCCRVKISFVVAIFIILLLFIYLFSI